ncbi:hypothetical protein GEMRC1_012902 [Eukaryota sp. GEM-RC1]
MIFLSNNLRIKCIFTQQTPSKGSALQRIPVVEGSALPSQPQVEVITIQEDSSQEGPALQSSSSLEESVLQDRTISKDTPPPTSPSFERIRAMFSGAPTTNKPFPTLPLSSSATICRNQEGLTTSKSAPNKKSQKGPVPSSLPIVDASLTPRAQDPVPHGDTTIVSHVTPTTDPDLEDLCDYDKSDDEESGKTPARGPYNHSQPPPLRSDTDTRGFQPHPIIPVQGFIPKRVLPSYSRPLLDPTNKG